ncbi:MAG: polysaccharide deacetylase family protein [Clostridiales bacterium]|jgi:polysaccharide deacetylase family sporulation protein PdaB|nr:polysaccharide deacetylase family protein [Clostridiales bacterium]
MFKSLPKKHYIRIALLALLVLFAAVNAPPAARMVFNTVASGAASRKLPIYSVDTPEKKLAISFDAAWGAEDTDQILEILRNNEVTATFFLCGYWVDKNPEAVKKIAEAGHDLGNHGNTHAHGAQLSLEQNKNEILRCHEKIKQLTGIESNLFRPPYGEYNNTVITAAEEVNYYPIQWDVDSHDWMNKGVDYEINRVLNNKNLSNGSIVLFHNDAKDTPKCLDTILKGLKDKGYSFVPVSELIHKENYYMDHTGRQKVKS